MCQQLAILLLSVHFFPPAPHWTSLATNPLASKGTWWLLPTAPSMLPAATKNSDRDDTHVSVHKPNHFKITQATYNYKKLRQKN